MNRRSFFTGLFTGAVAGTAGTVLARPAAQPAAAHTGIVEVFGVIRFPSGGPVILDDAGHTPQGLSSVQILSSGYLQINHTDLGVVGVAYANADETLADRGILAGVSQSYDYARIRFRDLTNKKTLNLSNSTDYNRLGGTNANIWFYARSAS